LKNKKKPSYCYIDLWSEDIAAGKEEAENKEWGDDKSAVGDNKEIVNRVENKETEEFLEDQRHECNVGCDFWNG